MIRQLRYAAVALLLASCSTLIDGQIQEVTIETVGAANTLCYMQNREFSFRFYPPQTLKVTKSADPYTIRCLAPGDRVKTIVVEPKASESSYYNIANLGVGAGVDHLSSAMYQLPDKIVINFEGVVPTGYAQPHYNDFFDKNPHLKGVEEFRPGQAALMRDSETPLPVLQKRDDGSNDMSRTPLGAMPLGEGAGMGAGAAMPGAVQLPPPPVPATSGGMSADELTRSMNPRIFQR